MTTASGHSLNYARQPAFNDCAICFRLWPRISDKYDSAQTLSKFLTPASKCFDESPSAFSCRPAIPLKLPVCQGFQSGHEPAKTSCIAAVIRRTGSPTR